jgi:putative ABC transport system permease protein
MRSILTMVGIIIAVMTVVTILSLVGGLDAFVREQIGNLGAASIVISRRGITNSQEEWLEASKRPRITLDHYEDLIRRLEGKYLYASPRIFAPLNLKFGNESLQYVTSIGCNEDMININERSLDAGRYFSRGEVRHKRNVVVIGAEIARQLFGSTDPIGRKLSVGGRPFTVIGVYTAQGTVMGQPTDDFIELPYTAFVKSFGIRRSVSISLRAPNQEALEEMTAAAEREMRAVRRLEPDEANDFGIISEELLVDTFEQMTGLIFAVMIVVGGISLIVGGIGIMNVMLVSVSERTREIGIRKAVGATNRDILNQFLAEAIIITAVGGVLGIALGAALGHIVGSLVDLPVSVSVGSVILSLGFSALVGVSFGIFPALKAARLDPIVALQKA